METFDGANKKPFKATGLLNKSQLKLASYIKANKDVTLQGTKRFMDKSGEYYLKNINLQNRKQVLNSTKKNSLNNPQNLENILNGNIGKIRKRASKIVTLLPENSLTPIPKKEGINKLGIANGYGKKELNDAQRTAVFIRRLEYATSMKKQMDKDKNLKNNEKKIEFIQQWWKTMFKIIKLQKNMRGFLFRKKLMNKLEHQEKLLKFITDFDNIHNYHIYKQFMDNLKKKRDYEKAKLMEKCEDFNDRMDNLEKLHNLKNFKNCFEKWKRDTKRKKKADLDNLAKKLNDVLNARKNKDMLDTLRTIKDQSKNEEDRLNDKARNFRENWAKKKFLEDLIKAHRLNKILSKVKKDVDDRQKKDALDTLKNYADLSRALENLNKLMEDKLKKDTFDDLKTMDFVEKVDDVINKHNDKVNDDAKKELLDKLKDIRDKSKLRDNLKKMKDFNDEMKNRNKILDKLKKYQQNELKRRAEEEKNKFAISSGVNDFELISEKKEPTRNEITPQNDLNFEAIPSPKMIFEPEGQNFSLIAPEVFKFGTPLDPFKKLANKPIADQLDNFDKKKRKEALDNLAKKLNDILTKAEQESDDQIKKDVFDKIKKRSNIGKAARDLDKLITDKLKKDALNDLKDFLTKPKKKTKRVSRRNRSTSKRHRSNKDKKLLKQAFDIWRENSSFEPTRNVLDRIKKKKKNLDKINDSEKDDLLQKYKNKMMQVLLNIYKRQRNLLLKKYLDRWKKTKKPEIQFEVVEPKYKKKPRIEDRRELSESEAESFRPTHYNQKQNLYNQRIPYKKRYAKMPYEQPEEFKKKDDEEEYDNKDEDNHDEDNNNDEDMDNNEEDNDMDNNIVEDMDNNEDDKYKNNLRPINKNDFSDTSSNNESNVGNGEKLIQNKKVIEQPRNYTSQSFFIDKNNAKNVVPTNYQINTHNTNQLPMTMKGDFVSLIEKNPKILTQKNPRIQVTNATCDLNQIINNNVNNEDELNSEEVNHEIDKLNNNFVIDKNKVLSKVIHNCDKDLYASQKPFKSKKDPYYSMSIPLNDNEAKWEFLDNKFKGERDKNTLNKFELIQKEAEPIKEENEQNQTTPYNIKTFKSVKNNNNSNNKDNSYKLREINYSQFYRSPNRTPRALDDEKSLIGSRIRRPGKRKGTQRSFLNSSRLMRNGRNNNIDRSRGKIEFDPKYRSIEYDNADDFEIDE